MATENKVREIEQVVTAHRQLEGAGFVVRRPFPGEIDAVDPFLLIDEMGPVDYAPGEAIGAPDHPHRGFETVTYVLEASSIRRCLRGGFASRAAGCRASRSGSTCPGGTS